MPGIILSIMTNVLRTEGVVVEAMLGVGDALETRLQELEVARREAEVAGEAAKAETARLLNETGEKDLFEKSLGISEASVSARKLTGNGERSEGDYK